MKISSPILLACSLLAALLFGEVIVRLAGHTDIDGNFYVRDLRCYPYQMPLNSLQEQVNRYLSLKNSLTVYDSRLGWTVRPDNCSRNGHYCYDKNGVRTGPEGLLSPKSASTAVVRILLFGDSFTHGDDVPFPSTWGYYLQRDLHKRGMDAQVFNLGVGGYGMDQAYLRWKAEGRKFAPTIVIFGLQLENLFRNANLVRPVYVAGTKIPFAKPRFVLNAGKLSLIDVPTPSPQELIGIIKDFSSWKWSKDEYWYDPKAYQGNILFKSKLIAFVYSWFKEHYAHRVYDGALQDLGLGIIDAFKKDVEADGAKFYMVYLPLKRDIKMMKERNIMPNTNFLSQIPDNVPVIHPETALLKHADDLNKLIPAHYSPRANKIVADVIADFIENMGRPR